MRSAKVSQENRTTDAPALSGRVPTRTLPTDAMLASSRMALFARMWGFAALFHLAGNGRDVFTPGQAPLAVIQPVLGLIAILVVLSPRRRWALPLLCLLIPLSAWFEAPFVGNHWVLAAAISIVALAAFLVQRLRGRPGDDPQLWTFFAPAARLTFLLAYGFAAFAKLNTDFFDPAVSCAVFYHDQLFGSWGLGAVAGAAADPVVGRSLAVISATIELAVPLLLILSRLRRAGLLLALSFHWLLAMDLGQHFWDFSAVLFAGFLLFADDEQVRYLVSAWSRLRAGFRPLLRRLLVTGGVLAGIFVAVASVSPVNTAMRVMPILVGHLAWWVYGTGVLVFVARSTASTESVTMRGVFRAPSAILYVVPLLVLVNGLTPYLEVKTGFGWNMYSNLRTVAGETNHLVVPATWDLTGLQGDQVEIIDASDEELVDLSEDDYVLVYSEFREYADRNPEAAVTYRRNGELHDVDRLADDPASEGSVSTISSRLQPFRPIDVSGRERCLTRFSPAR